MNRTRVKLVAQGGFTLLEVIVAVSVFVAMMTVAYQTLTGLTRTRIAIEEERDIQLLASAVLRRLTRELQLAQGGGDQSPPLLPPRGQTGAPSGRNIFFKGEPGLLADGRAGDRVSFIALEGGQYLPDGATHTGLVQISYRVDKDPDSGSYVLVRDEAPLVRPPEKAYEKSIIFPITKNVDSLKFRYFESATNSWKESWGDTTSKIPSIIEVTLGLRSQQGKVRLFTTAVSPKVSR